MWQVYYHPEVEADLRSLGHAPAKRIIKTIEERIIHGEPHKSGKPLRNALANCRRIRVGNTRIIYKIDCDRIEVLIITIGPRRNDFVYKEAKKRVL